MTSSPVRLLTARFGAMKVVAETHGGWRIGRTNCCTLFDSVVAVETLLSSSLPEGSTKTLRTKNKKMAKKRKGNTQSTGIC